MRFFSFVRLLFAATPEKVAAAPFLAAVDSYEPPLVVVPGGVRRITLGSSPSGNADANSQYYW